MILLDALDSGKDNSHNIFSDDPFCKFVDASSGVAFLDDCTVDQQILKQRSERQEETLVEDESSDIPESPGPAILRVLASIHRDRKYGVARSSQKQNHDCATGHYLGLSATRAFRGL